MTRVDWLVIHEGTHKVIAVNEGGFSSACQDFTENAGIHGSITVGKSSV
jgi:hypothetical protein